MALPSIVSFSLFCNECFISVEFSFVKLLQALLVKNCMTTGKLRVQMFLTFYLHRPSDKA